MEATRIDKEGRIRAALQAVGIKVDEPALERILNISDYVREHDRVVLEDIMRKDQCALGLFDMDDLSDK